MVAAGAMRIEVGAREDPPTTFARDQLMMLRCADDRVARARVWRGSSPGLQLGRFHRVDPASIAWPDGAATGASTAFVSRRHSGGRIVPIGPGVVCITIAVPLVDWLDPARKPLRPEQVLNRAIRPLLAMLRGDGIDAYYPGRDLVTAAGRPLAHASFTVLRDGVAIVEMHVAEQPAFAELPALLDRCDPAGIAGVDREALAAATSVVECGGSARSDEEWAQRFAHCAAERFCCDARVVADGDERVTLADAGAAHAFTAVPGRAGDGRLSAAAVSMLGIVECSARLHGDRVRDLAITGDLIAPFHTLDDVSTECEGEPFRPASIRKALARAMAGPRSFVLGLRDLDELILRLA